MNYIKRLEAELAELKQRHEAGQQEIREFREHLASAKFVGDDNGERKDWIATSDVINRLGNIRDAFYGIA